MPYLQVILLFVGMVMALGHFGSNHVNRTSGRTHYAWFHPRFLTLATTIVSSSWLLLWPIISVLRHEPLRGVLICTIAVGLCAVAFRWLNLLRRIALCVLMVPLLGLAAGGMPSDVSWTANLAIVNIAPTLYIFHHKGDDRLRDIITRHDIACAYVIWSVGHLLAYWSLVAVTFRIVGPILLWMFFHGKQMALGFVASVVGIGIGLLTSYIMKKRRDIRVQRAVAPVYPEDRPAPHFIIE